MPPPDPPLIHAPPPICRFEELARRENAFRDALHVRPTMLTRFLTAQVRVFDVALEEIRAGQKRSHWMWFIFPQLRGLGKSEMARLYGISSRREAEEFLQHPVLGPRFRLAVTILQDVVGKSAQEVFGSVDATKLRSSLTLFGELDDSGLFQAALGRWFCGEKDEATLKLLQREAI